MPNFSCLLDGCMRPSETRRTQGLCKMHLARLARHGSVGEAASKRRSIDEYPCEVPDCGKRRKSGRYCSMHTARVKRHGSVNVVRPNAVGRFVQAGAGYIKLTGSKHPLAIGGTVFEHRAVLYDSIGPGEHPCHWCGARPSGGSRTKASSNCRSTMSIPTGRTTRLPTSSQPAIGAIQRGASTTSCSGPTADMATDTRPRTWSSVPTVGSALRAGGSRSGGMRRNNEVAGQPDSGYQCAICLAWFVVRCLARDHEDKHRREAQR